MFSVGVGLSSTIVSPYLGEYVPRPPKIPESYMYSSSLLFKVYSTFPIFSHSLFKRKCFKNTQFSHFIVCLINPVSGRFAPLIQLLTRMLRLPVVLLS